PRRGWSAAGFIFHRLRQGVVGEIVEDGFIRPVLLEDLQDARVLVIAGRENPRWFAAQENFRVGAMPVEQAADDDHGQVCPGYSQFASGNLRRRVWIAPSGRSSLA